MNYIHKPVCIASTFYLGTFLLDGDDVMLTHSTFHNEYMYNRWLIDCRMDDLGDNNDLMLMIILIENVQKSTLTDGKLVIAFCDQFAQNNLRNKRF